MTFLPPSSDAPPASAAGPAALPSTMPAARSAPLALVRDYGDPAHEYAALRAGALLVDRSHRDRWLFRGGKARETLTGLVTNDVVGLAPGHGQYAAALTPKGRIIADVRIYALDDAPAADAGAGEPSWMDGAALLVDVPSRAADGWGAMIRKFVNPRLAKFENVRERVRVLGLHGVAARDALSAAFGAPPSALAALAPYAHATLVAGDATVLVVHVRELGVDGFELFVDAAHFDAVWTRVAHAVPGIVAGGEEAYAIARIEAGYPEWGVDVDDTTIPQEANLDELHAISYTKGCYTGQEVVARIHFRGHVNRHLRGLAYLADGGAIPRGAQLVDADGKVVGEVRSSAVSPRLGGIALGMVRREVALGATLRARWEAPAALGVHVASDDDGASSLSHAPERTPADGTLDGAAALQAHERGVTVGTLPFPL